MNKHIFDIGLKLGNLQQAIEDIDFHGMWEWLGDEGIIDILDRMLGLWMELDNYE